MAYSSDRRTHGPDDRTPVYGQLEQLNVEVEQRPRTARVLNRWRSCFQALNKLRILLQSIATITSREQLNGKQTRDEWTGITVPKQSTARSGRGYSCGLVYVNEDCISLRHLMTASSCPCVAAFGAIRVKTKWRRFRCTIMVDLIRF